jgi:hypothetical protein
MNASIITPKTTATTAKNLIADKGYGRAENDQILEDRGIQAFIQYRHWDQEQKKRSKKYRYKWWRISPMMKMLNCATCPEGNHV